MACQKCRRGETGDATADHNHILLFLHRGMLASREQRCGCRRS